MYKLLLELHKQLDVYTPSLKQIATKHNVELSYIRNQLIKGIKVELEHTSDKNVAEEIALDHLNEKPNYYELLEKVEKE